ncbi:hypothetical protein PHJA_000513800 [Phtheirospermum japonicum]|uniref:DUF7086 domain-containing protein n=1 Tax=Phtheirospermum japonicum TaxID=374723 RepID=A0A830BHT1_9LAMI|nr:hypothetical protein PHJA_000513800 [Phtheirospermum japonicum]
MNNGLNENHADFLSLSLSTPSPAAHAPPPPHHQPPAAAAANHGIGPGKAITIPPPYPWATTRRATAHGLHYLLAKGINTISGAVQCKRCDRRFDVEHDLQKRFSEVAILVMKKKDDMRHRAPPEWMNPSLPDCRFCEQRNCAKPVPSEKKKDINWVFLFLGQMIGCCKLAELKYFCKHTRNHRTGAKDRVLYLTYLEICRQLDPNGPYDR